MKFCTSIAVHDSRQRTHPKIHEKYKFPAFPHPKSHKFLKPLIYLQLETSESPKSIQKDTNFQHFKCTHWPLSIVTNKDSTFPNFALFTLCTHFQDHYFVAPVLSRPYLKFNQMHSITPYQHHHKPTPLTFLGTPVNAFLYFADQL